MQKNTQDVIGSISCLSPDGQIGIDGLIPRLLIHGSSASKLTHAIEVKASGPKDWIFRAVVKNVGSSPLTHHGIRWATRTYGPSRVSLKYPPTLNPEIFHTENLRGDYFGIGTNLGNTFFEPIRNRTTIYGSTEDRPFPGVLVQSKGSPWRVFAALFSQDTFHIQFLLRGGADVVGSTLEIEETNGASSPLSLAAGDTLYGEWIWVSVVEASEWPQTIRRYTEEVLDSRGARERIALNPLVQERIWCSWNYDFYDKIDEEKVLRQIPVIQKHFPDVKFLQLDHGYQGRYESGQIAQIDFLYGNADAAVNRRAFPDGLDGLAKKIRAAGLRPAIWLGLWANETSPMIRENPEWILLDDCGEPMRLETSAKYFDTVVVLDPSVPGVQEYLRHVSEVVFKQWGYEGLKLDFSSMAFESKRVRFRRPGFTGVQLRRRLVEIFREFLPQDGFFGWCVVTGTVNPFLTAEGADYARMSLDINNAYWSVIVEIGRWLANSLLLNPLAGTYRNIDSIGRHRPNEAAHFLNDLPGPTDAEWQTWLNLAAISGGALEISGDLTRLPENEIERMSRCVNLCRPDARCWAGQDILENGLPPYSFFQEVGGHRLAAIFNWTESPRDFTPADVINSHFPAAATLLDAWTEQPIDSSATLTLPPHSSALFRIA